MPEPGLAPDGERTAGTLFAAMYGTLVPHAWHDPEHDAYSLFYQLSLGMGWLDVLWGMNDAGWEHPLGAPGLVSWFQVEANAVAEDRPLPVRPFLWCAEHATARAGTPDLSAMQVLLPVQGLDAAARPPYVPSMAASQWFAECDPRARTPVAISISSGRDAVLPVARSVAQVFGFETHDVAVREDLLPPPFDDGFWNGPGLPGVVLRGELAEWSGDAVGWLAGAVADLAAQLGVRSPVLLTVRRSPGR